jgi:hypothetical protein
VANKKKGHGGGDGKDLHMFVWSSSASPVSEGGIHVFRGGGDYGNDQLNGAAHQKGFLFRLINFTPFDFFNVLVFLVIW